MRYVFDEYELNTQTCELLRSGIVIPLAPKAYEVLAYLVEHHDRLVSKTELLEQIWPDTYVDDSAVKRNVMAIRRAINKPSGGPQRIKTQRGQGYRFITTVIHHPFAPSAESVSPTADTTHAVKVPSQSQTSSDDEDVAVQYRMTCHHANGPMARFCVACGMSLSRMCPHCHAQVSVAAVFCQACGQALAEVDSQPSPLEERKLITACCGMVSRPPEGQGLELDTLHRVMQRVCEVARIEVERYEGAILYTTGEGFLAIFGAPMAQEDHARRALLAALSLRRRLLASSRSEKGSTSDPIVLHMALHTGMVIVGQKHDDASGLAPVVGRVTTIATAFAQQAAPHALVASEATLGLLQDEVRTAPIPVGKVQTDGTSIPAYEILEFLPRDASRVLMSARPRSLFTGRNAELDMMRTRLDRAVQGRGQVVAIIGEPGLGKSRLLREFCSACKTEEVQYFHGTCRSYGQTTPYLPLLELLRNTWGLADTDNAEAMSLKVIRGLQDVQLEADAFAPYFLSLLGVQSALEERHGTNAEMFKARIFAALHQFFLHSSKQRPCIIAIEDMHWIDATSEAYLTALVERLAGMPIIMLVTFRPGYRPTWFDKSYATQVALQPLAYDESLNVLQATMNNTTLAESLIRQLLAKAEGNPFFIEELARTFVDDGESQHTMVVPETIHAVLAARIDRLPPTEKRLLQTAAVIGPEIPLSLLKTLSTHPEEDLQHLLERLQSAEFIYETQFIPEPIYAFKHVLTCEVAYASLLQEHRQTLHVHLAQTLETLRIDHQYQTDDDLALDQVDLLARHTYGGELWDKASFYYRQAGIKAMARSAYHEAVTCFEQALDSLQHLPTADDLQAQRIDLRLNLHDALRRLGDLGRSVAVLQEAHPLAEALDDARRLGWISSYLSTHCLMVGDSDGAIQYSQRAHALASTCADIALQLDVRLHLGQAYHVRGAYTQAAEFLRHNITFLQAPACHTSPMLETVRGLHTYAWLILCLAETGEFGEAISHTEDVLQRVATHDIPYDQVVTYGSAGFLYLRQGQPSEAIEMLERSLDICRTAGIPHMFPTIAAHLGAAYTAGGRLSEAIALLEQAIQTAQAMHIMVYHAPSVIYLGEAYLFADRLREAHEQALHALTLCQNHKEWGHRAWCLHLLGEIAARGDACDCDQAAMFFQQALDQATERGMRPLQAHCQFALGSLDYRCGRQRQAQDRLSAATELYRAMEMHHNLARAEVVLTQLD